MSLRGCRGDDDTWRQIQAGGGCSSVSAGCCYLCLYISAKIHEDASLKLDHIKLLSGNLFTPEDVEKEESLILNAVEWRVNPPTPSAFSDEILNVIPSRMISYLMRLLPVDMLVHDFNVLTTI
eukprot:scaffold1223_cov119-Cylindrotheca_fusiformis.AAC.24